MLTLATMSNVTLTLYIIQTTIDFLMFNPINANDEFLAKAEFAELKNMIIAYYVKLIFLYQIEFLLNIL